MTTTTTTKTIIITSVSAFIRPRSASQLFPLAACLNRALVGSTCHMGGSRGGWWGRRGLKEEGGGGGERSLVPPGLTFLQYPSLPPPPNLSSLSNVVCRGTRFALRLLYTLSASRCSELFQIATMVFFFIIIYFIFFSLCCNFYLKERSGPLFFFFFPPFKSSANWFLPPPHPRPRLKRTLILLMPDGVRKIFTGVKHGYIKIALRRGRSRLSWSI